MDPQNSSKNALVFYEKRTEMFCPIVENVAGGITCLKHTQLRTQMGESQFPLESIFSF